MAEKHTLANAIKMAESGNSEGDYTKVGGLVRGARLIGAYQFPSDQWDQMAADVGLPGARWRDPRAQDLVARRTLDLLYQKYGDWRLVAVAWKAGEEIADLVAQDARLLDTEQLKPVKDYMRQVMEHARSDIEVNKPAQPDGTPIAPQRFQPTTQGLAREPRSSAEDTMRGILQGMRDRVRAQTPAQPEETAEAVEAEKPGLVDRMMGRG